VDTANKGWMLSPEDATKVLLLVDAALIDCRALHMALTHD